MARPKSEFLVISRGKWDPALAPERIQTAIDDFYVWIDGLVADGKMKHGQRLGTGGKSVARRGVITDGPFGETKEVIGGYWFVLADSLDEAARLLTGNPCVECGLVMEVRPIDPERASAFDVTNETPAGRRPGS